MSLLNQVLQDLDARQPQVPRPVLHTAAPSVVEHAADDFADLNWQATLRPGIVIAAVLLGILLVAWVFERSWQFAAQTGPAMRSQSLDLPAPVARPRVTIEQLIPEPQAAAQPQPATASAAAPLPAAAPVVPAPTTELGPRVGSEHAHHGAADETFLPLRNAALADLPDESGSAVDDAAHTPRPVPSKSIRPVAADPLAPARQAIAAGELAEAEAALTGRLRQVPQDLQARELLIGLMLRGERSGDALRELDAGLVRHPAHGSFVLIKARLLAQSGDNRAAIAFLQRHAKLTAIRAQRLQMLGALYQQEGRFRAAAEHYRALLAVEPGSAAGWVGLAISLDARGDNGAAAAYRRALRIGGLPTSAETYARGRLAELE